MIRQRCLVMFSITFCHNSPHLGAPRVLESILYVDWITFVCIQCTVHTLIVCVSEHVLYSNCVYSLNLPV